MERSSVTYSVNGTVIENPQTNPTMNFPDRNVDCRLADVGSKRKKRVCFAPDDPEVCGRQTLAGGMTEIERFQGWWQNDEYEGTKASAKTMCRKMRRMEETNGCLSDAYDRACSIAASIDLETVHAAQVLTPNEVSELGIDIGLCYMTRFIVLTRTLPSVSSKQQSLIQYCRRDDIRGLERWLCRTYAVSRAKCLSDTKHAVLLEQARQFLSQERDEEAIARVAQGASREGRAFAAMLGGADAAAAKLDEIPSRNGKFEPVQDYAHEDPISDESCQEDQHTASPIFISIKTLA